MPETRRHVLEELLTKARTLNDDSGYDPAFKEETLWDTLVFGLRSDKGRKDAISKGNSFTFQQVYDLAKTEESTKAQMQAITHGYQVGSVHSVRRKQKSDAPAPPTPLDVLFFFVCQADCHDLRFAFFMGLQTLNLASTILS